MTENNKPFKSPEAMFAARLLEALQPERYGHGPKTEEEIAINSRKVMEEELEFYGITWTDDADFYEKWINYRRETES